MLVDRNCLFSSNILTFNIISFVSDSLLVIYFILLKIHEVKRRGCTIACHKLLYI